MLHNMCVDANIPAPEEEEDEELDLGMIQDNLQMEAQIHRINPDLAKARRKRERIVRNYFAN